jgi:hypothetical protein
VTAEGPTGAPLRQQIAEAIHGANGQCDSLCTHVDDIKAERYDVVAADAVLALLNLTPVARNVDDTGIEVLTSWAPGETLYRVGLPSHHTDSSEET